MTKKVQKIMPRMRFDAYLGSRLKDPEFALLYYQARAELELEVRVAEVLNRAAKHLSGGGYDKNFYETISKKCGVSPRSLRRFLESGCSIRKAAKILHPLGYHITKISVEKLPEY